MDNFIQLPLDEQRVYYEQASAKLNLPAPAIEKDFWVCWTLDKLFSMPEWQYHLTFKGGTSLSKVWNLIQRFSEDIDLIMSRSLLGFDGDSDPELAGTPSQKQARIKRLKKSARERVSGDMVSLFQKVVCSELPDGNSKQVVFDEKDEDNDTLLFYYPRAMPDKSHGVMLPYVKVEIGPRGDDWPAHKHFVKPYLEESLPGTLAFREGAQVNVLDAERTFLEKAMLLHEDTFRPHDRPRKPRMARHYYDLYCMIEAGIGERAISDKTLFARVREHRQFYYPVSWVDYDTMTPGRIRIVPTKTAISAWNADYNAMRKEFFFGDTPSFEEIISVIAGFEKILNQSGDALRSEGTCQT